MEARSDLDKSELLAAYFGDLFADESAKESIPQWVFGKFEIEDLAALRAVDGYFLKEVLVDMGKGKSCAEEDNIVVEMLLHLPEEILEVLAALFQDRILNWNAKDDTHVWAFNSVCLIAKCAGAQFVTEFRPIALLPVMYKWYSKMLLEMAKPQIQNLSRFQFAFRKGHQAGEVQFIIRNLIEKANEWQTTPPGHIYILDGDIYKAYDETRHLSFIEGLRRKKVQKILIAAWVREIRRMVSSVKLGKTVSKYVARNRSLVQGDPAAPYLFNASLDSIIIDFTEKCDSNKWGYDIDGEKIAILVFADNFWLLPNSLTHLESMYKLWIEMLSAKGWQVPPEECVWCSTIDDSFTFEIRDHLGKEIRRAERTVGFKVLGAWISFDNSCTREVDYRVGQSWKAFGAHRDMLCNKKASLRKRFDLPDKVVLPSISWGEGHMDDDGETTRSDLDYTTSNDAGNGGNEKEDWRTGG